jgi:hypothetical protein
MEEKVKYELVVHRGLPRILVQFKYNPTWIDRLRKTTDAKWSKTHQAWHIADTAENRKNLVCRWTLCL